jgi:alpha-N-arabinofuranosidase
VQPYNGSFWVYAPGYNGSYTVKLTSYLTNETLGAVVIEARASCASQNGWLQYEYTLTPWTAASNSNNTFTLTYDASMTQSLDFNLISLFPPTYNNRPNGMRIDLMEILAGLKPSFLRLPGGNNIEGNYPGNLWYWNETIGPLIDRPGREGTWSYYNT